MIYDMSSYEPIIACVIGIIYEIKGYYSCSGYMSIISTWLMAWLKIILVISMILLHELYVSD